AREVGLHRLNQTARRSCAQITLDRIGPGDYTELGSSAVMFFEINNRAKCRAVPALRQSHNPVRLRDRQGAIGCAKIKPDCFHQAVSSNRALLPLAILQLALLLFLS